MDSTPWSLRPAGTGEDKSSEGNIKAQLQYNELYLHQKMYFGGLSLIVLVHCSLTGAFEVKEESKDLNSFYIK